MNHKISGRKFGKQSAHRIAMMSNMATSLLQHGRIKSTHLRCKELRKVVEKLITAAKQDSVHARRKVAKVVRDKTIIRKLFTEIAPEFKERPGGYTQILQLGPRMNDGAHMSFIQLVGFEPKEVEE